MWLLTAIGPVHGQNSFTFALEQRKTYTVGRDKECDIRFEGRTVRPQQGTVIVGDWDPTNPTKPPDVRWRSEPKKSGVFPSFNTVTPRGTELYGSLDKGDYELDGIDEGTMGCYLHDTDGMGVEVAENAWFLTKWIPLAICHEKMKDEDEAWPSILLRYCIYHTPAVEEERIPDVVISSSYRAITTNNYAVCYGVRIVKPNYLSDLIKHLAICWKKVADSQDSFVIPDSADEEYRPSLDDALPLTRKQEAMWLPNPRRRRLFAGWKILGLRTKNAPSEKRYLLAMGVEYDDVDITSDLPKTAKAFESKIETWVKSQKDKGGLDKCLIVHFARVKEEFKRAKVDFNAIVGTVCSQLGVIVVSGNVCWGAVADGGVQAYIDHLSANLPMAPAPPVEATVPAEATSAATRRSTRQTSVDPPSLPTTQTRMPQSSGAAAGQTPFIPSTFPEETDVPLKAPPSAQLPRQTTPEVSESTGATSRRPLKKRTAKKIDLFAEDLGVIPESSAFVMDVERSQRVVSQRSEETRVRDSQESLSQEAETNSMAPRSRLKRRAGPQTQSQFDFGFDESFDVDKKKEETAAEIREVYEQTIAASRPPPSKRQRLSEEPERAGSVSRSTTGMEVDEPEEGVEDIEDPMQSMLRKAREAREAEAQATLARKAQLATQKSMAPPPVPKQRSRNRSPSEEVEQVEVKKSKSKSKMTQNEPDVDNEFQKAIKKSKKDKKDLDELDKDFNALKIPKSKVKPVQAVATMVYDYPDYNIVNDFDDDMRGNFIQIVRKDLFRKDIGQKAVERVDDGKPNFKKFKKKNIIRREPVKLALAAPNIHDAEMGEPYWVTESLRPGQTQAMSQRDDGDEEMPLLPPSKRRLMAKDDSGFDESIPASKSRRGAAPSASLSTQRPARTTRGSSVQSDASSAPSTSTRSKSTAASRKKPAARGKQTAAPVVVEDSEDEVAEDLDKTPSAYTSGLTGRSRVTGTRGMSGIGATSTLEGDRSRASRTTQATPSGTGTQSRGANGRRKLLVDDDDDDDIMVFKGPQKKRRLL